MLRELSIRNFAIIDDLTIRFSEGLTILSGETGAGKSIIINAVNLLLGSRASAKLIRTGEEKAELEALFDIAKDSAAAKMMAELGYENGELLIQRHILSNERHRVYLNGRLATMQVLAALTENLASISGQHAHQGLLKEDQHLIILDQYAGVTPLKASLSTCYHAILPLIAELRVLFAKQENQASQRELLEFQRQEIDQAMFQVGEDEDLDKERNRLRNAQMLNQVIHRSLEVLYSQGGAVVESIGEVKKNLDKAAQIDADLRAPVQSLTDIAFQIEEVAETLRQYLKTIEFDEGRLEAIESRLNLLTRLKRKYGGSLPAVAEKLKRIEQELATIENISDKIAVVQSDLDELHRQLADLAVELSEKRAKAAKILCQKVEKELDSLHMSKTQFEVQCRPIPASRDCDPYLSADGHAIGETGFDRVTFMIAPNPGEAIKPLAHIASGGELSRVVLALKAILADTDAVATIVFDEVDAGIGGRVADAVGQKLKALARRHQIICITHLPQIAKFGEHHFKIIKSVFDGRTKTTICPMDQKERVQEIARMLGGAKITQTTLKHARELLES